ncbi:hypothetical protein SC984_00790 [Legionella pneumophila serogroup 1]
MFRRYAPRNDGPKNRTVQRYALLIRVITNEFYYSIVILSHTHMV